RLFVCLFVFGCPFFYGLVIFLARSKSRLYWPPLSWTSPLELGARPSLPWDFSRDFAPQMFRNLSPELCRSSLHSFCS
ncbi:hypothetical protein DFJ73DRAFT_851432, partial [Zopfochytrium polystomum]